MCVPRSHGRRCGRPTKAATPCKQRADGYLPACSIHSTSEEVELAAQFTQVERTAWAEGNETGMASANHRVEYLQAQLDRLSTLIDSMQTPERVI